MMKINKQRLNLLFDQYSNPENRLTHALLHTIGSSGWLLTRFLKDLVGVKFQTKKLFFEISTQKVPFGHGDVDHDQIQAIPDAWIIEENLQLGIAIEVKDRKNNLNKQQLEWHKKRIYHYENKYLLVITPDLSEPPIINILREEENTENGKVTTVWRSWDNIYRWLSDVNLKKSSIQSHEKFLITAMTEYLERRREVLGFQGILFSSGFDVYEAKEILNAEMVELMDTVLSQYKELNTRRPAITTFSKGSVWDCFGSKEGFTRDLHITLSITENWHDISITIPNSAKAAWKRLRQVFTDGKYMDTLLDILRDLRKEVPHLYIEFNQRHFKNRKFGVRDGYMEFSIDTLGSGFSKKDSSVKEFPIWREALKEAIINKKKINGQVMFKCRYFYDEVKNIDKPEFLNTARKNIYAFDRLYKFLRESI